MKQLNKESSVHDEDKQSLSHARGAVQVQAPAGSVGVAVSRAKSPGLIRIPRKGDAKER